MMRIYAYVAPTINTDHSDQRSGHAAKTHYRVILGFYRIVEQEY